MTVRESRFPSENCVDRDGNVVIYYVMPKCFLSVI